MRKGILQPHTRETVERGFPAAVDDFDSRQSGDDAAEQLWPILDAAGISHAFRVVCVPVGPATGFLAVISEQNDAACTSGRRQLDGACSAVHEGQLLELSNARNG